VPVQDDRAGKHPREQLSTLALQPFRFLGVVHVATYHIEHHYPLPAWAPAALQRLCERGDLQVQIFFLLSGFCLYVSHQHASKISWNHFLRKRVLGMYPVYLAGVSLAIWSKSLHHDWRTVLGQFPLYSLFFMVESLVSPYVSLNAPSWFTSNLFVFWLFFPRWHNFIRGLKYPGIAASLAWLTSSSIPLVHTFLGNTHPSQFAEYHPLSNWSAFVLGMFVARLLPELQMACQIAPVGKYAASASAITLLAMFTLPHPAILELYFFKGTFVLPVAAALFVFVSLGQDVVLRPEWLQNPWLLWLGSVSGPFFMLHYAVMIFLTETNMIRPAMSPLVAIGRFLSLSFVIAALFHAAQERLLARAK
jgi:peptidoglycan/LPS O-acetylase OafA/YrhL